MCVIDLCSLKSNIENRKQIADVNKYILSFYVIDAKQTMTTG